jgi:hypothetical protein
MNPSSLDSRLASGENVCNFDSYIKLFSFCAC